MRTANVVRFDPTNPSRVLLHDVDRSRTFMSNDGAQTWTQGATGRPYWEDQVIRSATQPLLVFVSTGQEIYRSLDGGASLLAIGPTCPNGCNKFLAADRVGGETLWS